MEFTAPPRHPPILGQWNFGYDDLNRLTTAAGVANGSYTGVNVATATQAWTYDSFGNRLTQSSGNNQTPTEWAQYASANNRMSDNSLPGTVSYDGAGRLASDGSKSYLWEAQGWLCGVAVGTAYYQYIYDAEGRLVTTASRGNFDCNTGTTTKADFVVDQAGRQVSETDGAGTWKHTNVYANGELLLTYDPAGVHYALSDWIGDKRVQASWTGASELSCWNFPFNDGFGCSASDATEHRYTGKEHDPYTGLDLFGAREFTGYSGRFLSPDDPFEDQDFSNPQSWNMYSYVRNNPLTNTDPDGRSVQVCTTLNGTQTCSGAIDNGVYSNAAGGANGGLNVPSLQSLQANGSGNITDSNGNTVGTATYTPDNSGIEGPAAMAGFNQFVPASKVVNAVGTVEMTAVSLFMSELLASATPEIGLGVGGVGAARAANYAEALAKWKQVPPGQKMLLDEWLGLVKGASGGSGTPGPLSPNLTRDTIQAYRDIASAAGNVGRDGVGSQAMRLPIIDSVLNSMK